LAVRLKAQAIRIAANKINHRLSGRRFIAFLDYTERWGYKVVKRTVFIPRVGAPALNLIEMHSTLLTT